MGSIGSSSTAEPHLAQAAGHAILPEQPHLRKASAAAMKAGAFL